MAEILKKLTVGNPIEVNKLKISISWMDEDKDLNFIFLNAVPFGSLGCTGRFYYFAATNQWCVNAP